MADVKRSWKSEEEVLSKWCKKRKIPLVVVLNKIDKVGQGERVKKKREYEAIEGIEKVFCVSALKSKGIKEVVDFLFENWS